MTNADLIIESLQAIGVGRIFGMPGGGSNADLIEAAGRAGLPFTLAHTEAASLFMATAQAEITGRPGACIATLGPGAASAMNGIANAFLDRVPLILLTDCASDPLFQHQSIPHSAMFGPLVKWTGRLREGHVEESLRCAISAVLSDPPGPVHIDISTGCASAPAECKTIRIALQKNNPPPISESTRELLSRSKRPVFLVGLGGRNEIGDLCERHRIPALVTYKAKGSVPDQHPWFGGVLTNGALERDVLNRADLFIAIGLDPVELLPRAWTLSQPMISVNRWPFDQRQIPFTNEITSPVEELEPFLHSDWDVAEIAQFAEAQREKMRPDGDGLRPHRVVELVAETYAGSRATVDAGAHMFPVMSLWPAEQPSGVLISNGLSTMGFALPAAIGAALLDRSQPVVAFTGDGGILMCVSELLTASRENLPIRVIVFNDGDLTLIRMKQKQRSYREEGVTFGSIDWIALAAGFYLPARTASTEEELRRHLRETADLAGPVLIDAKISPLTYEPMMRALRG